MSLNQSEFYSCDVNELWDEFSRELEDWNHEDSLHIERFRHIDKMILAISKRCQSPSDMNKGDSYLKKI